MSKTTYKEKVIIITGASAGIGKELARQLAKQGAYLVLAARDEQKLNEIAARCNDSGAKTLVVKTDVSDESQCRLLVEKTVEHFERIDVVVNNAGVSMWARFDEISDLSLFEKIIRINYLGGVYLTYYALPHLKKAKGQIVAISSLTGKNGVPTRTGYAASKHAMAGFFDSLRIELIESKVSVTTIYPGFVATEVRERAFNKDGKSFGESPMEESGLMSVEQCVSLTLKAMSKRQRELVMTARGKAGLWVKLIAPSLVDKIALKMIKEK